MSRRKGIARRFKIIDYKTTPAGMSPYVADRVTDAQLVGGMKRGEIRFVDGRYEFTSIRRPQKMQPQREGSEPSPTGLTLWQVEACAGLHGESETLGLAESARTGRERNGEPTHDDIELALIKLEAFAPVYAG